MPNWCYRWILLNTEGRNYTVEYELFQQIEKAGLCPPSFFKQDFIYFFLERGKGKEKERERNISVWLPLVRPLLGTWHVTQAGALSGNWTSSPLVHRLALNPRSHTSHSCRYICSWYTRFSWVFYSSTCTRFIMRKIRGTGQSPIYPFSVRWKIISTQTSISVETHRRGASRHRP